MATMAPPTFKGQREPVNIIHQQAILNETIKKEMRHHQLTTNFTINPFRPSKYDFCIGFMCEEYVWRLFYYEE